jgi:hypothetical protein
LPGAFPSWQFASWAFALRAFALSAMSEPVASAPAGTNLMNSLRSMVNSSLRFELVRIWLGEFANLGN